jgi:hypothetical protein
LSFEPDLLSSSKIAPLWRDTLHLRLHRPSTGNNEPFRPMAAGLWLSRKFARSNPRGLRFTLISDSLRWPPRETSKPTAPLSLFLTEVFGRTKTELHSPIPIEVLGPIHTEMVRPTQIEMLGLIHTGMLSPTATEMVGPTQTEMLSLIQTELFSPTRTAR